MADVPHVLGPLSSDQVAKKAQDYAAAVQSEYALKGLRSGTVDCVKSEYALNELKPTTGEKPTKDAEKVASEYVLDSLRSFQTVQGNPLYQAEPTQTKMQGTTTNTGNPISGQDLKRRLAYLENVVYTPSIVDGKLFFVSVDNDTKTARTTESLTKTAGATDNLENISFTFGQLTKMLGTGTMNDLLSKYKGFAPVSVTGSENTTTATGNMLTAAEKSAILNTAASRTLLTNASSLCRTAASRTMVTGQEKSDSVFTAGSRTMLTGQEKSDSIFTAGSRTMITGQEMSDLCRTAASRTMITGQEMSDLCRTAASRTMITGQEMSDLCRTAASRTMVTGQEKSDSVYTAGSRTMLTGAEMSDLCHTAGSRTMLTGAEMSDPCLTARGAEASDSTHTALDLLSTAELKKALVRSVTGEVSEDSRTAILISEETRTARDLLDTTSEPTNTALEIDQNTTIGV